MLTVVLFEPEIPANTGNIIRLCANTGTELHLVKPLGFDLDDKKLLRAGLDYHEFARLIVHTDWHQCYRRLQDRRIFAITTKGSVQYSAVQFQSDDVLLFGPETRGLPIHIRQTFPTAQQLRIPMLAHSRSLNLANAVSVIVYEAWRQFSFQGSL